LHWARPGRGHRVTALQAGALYLVLRDTSALGNTSVRTPETRTTQSVQVVATVIGMLAQTVLQGVLTVVTRAQCSGGHQPRRRAWAQARPRCGG